MSYYNQGPPYQQPNSPYPPQQGNYQQPYPQQGHQQSHAQQGMNQGYPPPMGGYPPQNGYGPPPGQQPFQQQPPQNQYPPQGQGYGPPSGPPPGQYGGGYGGPTSAPTPPSPGYVPGQMSYMDMSGAADELRKAMKGLGTDEKALARVLGSLGPLEINSVKAAFQGRHHRDLVKDVHGETSGYFRDGLEAILRGPLDQDCHELYESIKGVGTKESAMNDVLLGRSNADLNAIKQHYHQKYHRSLESDVKGDLSMKTERLFDMVMSARRNEESAPVIPQEIDGDIQAIYHATEGRSGTDQVMVCSILTSRSNGQIRALAQQYHQRYHRSLEDVIKKEFSGHMQDALLYIVHIGEDPAKHDADLLEDAMRGLGTNDKALIRRVVMVHWSPERLNQAKAAFRHFYKKELLDRIRSETRGDYERLMLACIGVPPR